jgi:membrane-associated phospholipid phosphatase
MVRRWRLALAAVVLAAAAPAQASQDDWDKASDIGYGLLVAGAIAVPLAAEDDDNRWEATLRAGGSIGAAWGVTEILKRTVREERPDGSDRRSFPSGHSSQSFAAAGSLHKRYGWKAGLPAHAVAAFVATARVKADKHHVHDVLVGAAIGEASAWLIVQPMDSRVRWVPWGDTKSAGAAVSYRF